MTFLTPSEVRTLTGRAHREPQKAVLRANGIPFFVNAAGWAIVARTAVEGELLQLLERIAERKRREQRISPYLLVTERGERLTYAMLYDRFDKARKAAGVQFNLRQIRAKAGTDKAESEGLEAAQAQLGHASITTTEIA